MIVTSTVLRHPEEVFDNGQHPVTELGELQRITAFFLDTLLVPLKKQREVLDQRDGSTINQAPG